MRRTRRTGSISGSSTLGSKSPSQANLVQIGSTGFSLVYPIRKEELPDDVRSAPKTPTLFVEAGGDPEAAKCADVMANQTLALSLVLQGPRSFLVRLALAEDLIDENQQRVRHRDESFLSSLSSDAPEFTF